MLQENQLSEHGERTLSSLLAAPVSDFHMLTRSFTTGVILILAATPNRFVASASVRPEGQG